MDQNDKWLELTGLVQQAQKGDQEAFRELLLAHRDAVVSTLIACGVRSPATTLDLAQDVALRVWTGLPNLREARTFRAWIRRIAANAARDYLRRQVVRREESLDAALGLASEDNPHHDAERQAELSWMLAALETEDEETVTLLVARAEGSSVDELATSLGVSPGALKMRLMRARKRLRMHLEILKASGDLN